MNAAKQIIEAAAAIRACDAAIETKEIPAPQARSAATLHAAAGMMAVARHLGTSLTQIHAADAVGLFTLASRREAGDAQAPAFTRAFHNTLDLYVSNLRMNPAKTGCTIHIADARRIVLALGDELSAA
jgi:hypothetical protein